MLVSAHRPNFSTIRAVDLIRKKRDSGEHSREEIDIPHFSAYTRDEFPINQGCLAEACLASFAALSRAELASLHRAMLPFRRMVDHSSLPAKK